MTHAYRIDRPTELLLYRRILLVQYGTAVDIWDLIAGASRFNCVQMAPCQTGRNSTLCGKWGRQIGFGAEHCAIALRDLVACVVRRTVFNDAKMIMTKIDIRGRRDGKC